MLAARLCVVVLTCALAAQVRSPKELLGHEVGEDRWLFTYEDLVKHWTHLASASDRLKLETIGTTSYGQKMVMAVVSSPENLRESERYRSIAARLARAKEPDEKEARALADDGKSVVWIDGGLHATESIAGQNIMELVWRLVSKDDKETQRIRSNVITLVCPVNPDGMEMIARGYRATGKVGGLPVLYQRFMGHDNNRDFYMMNASESVAINRVLYERWFPQIVYNHHQTGPRGTVIFTPPFRDPFNYNVDPLVVRGIDLVAAHMNDRFTAEGKAGVISRSGASYSTWWNGGLRTTAYFHNMIGILTEVIGSPNPSRVTQTLERRLPSGDYPLPIESREWHARDTIEYLQTANFAILDLAARYREKLLFDIWRMGRRQIELGSRDHWTVTPALVEKAKALAKEAATSRPESAPESQDAPREDLPETRPSRNLAESVFRDPRLRDARAYVIPAGQRDPGAAIRFVKALVQAGIEVERADRSFTCAFRTHAPGSFIVRCDQAFRPHVRDMFEPQWHPRDVDAKGDPIRPYDSAGWTLAMQMDLVVERVLDAFDQRFPRVIGEPRVIPGSASARRAGWITSHSPNAALTACGRLVRAGDRVLWLTRAEGHEPGTIFVARGEGTEARVEALASGLGLAFQGVDEAPRGEALALAKPRVGLFDTYGGSMEVGWTSYVLLQHEVPFVRVSGAEVESGDLRRRFDVLVFHAGLPQGQRQAIEQPAPGDRVTELAMKNDEVEKLVQALPPFEDWTRSTDRLVRITREKGMANLRTFVEQGGTLLALGEQAAALARLLSLPIESRRPPRGEFYVPGSLLCIAAERADPIAFGMSESCAVMFRSNPILELAKDATWRVAARYGAPALLSGWAIGEDRLLGKPAVLAGKLGEGEIVLYGPDVIYRGQPHGTFKLVLNAIVGAGAAAVRLP